MDFRSTRDSFLRPHVLFRSTRDSFLRPHELFRSTRVDFLRQGVGLRLRDTSVTFDEIVSKFDQNIQRILQEIK